MLLVAREAIAVSTSLICLRTRPTLQLLRKLEAIGALPVYLPVFVFAWKVATGVCSGSKRAPSETMAMKDAFGGDGIDVTEGARDGRRWVSSRRNGRH